MGLGGTTHTCAYTVKWCTVLWAACAVVCGATTQAAMLGLVTILLGLALRFGSFLLGGAWFTEVVIGLFFGQLSWYALWSASSLAGFVIWLEVSTLLALLVISTWTLRLRETAVGGLEWPSAGSRGTAQLGFLTSLIIFLWLSGFATMALIWGLSSLDASGAAGLGY